MLNRKGSLFIVSAPAGTGKTTLVSRLLEEFPHIKRSISFTTREPRSDEVNGLDYHFISEKEFKKKIDNNEFLEYVTLYGFHYGTSRLYVEQELLEGRHVVLVIDTQGFMKIKEETDAICIFLKPPSLEELKSRLKNRKTDTEEQIAKRLAWAEKELKQEKNYHYVVVNTELDDAYDALRSIVIAEEHRIK